MSFNSSGVGCAVAGANHQAADLGRSDIRAKIDAAALLRQALEIFLQRAPVGGDVVVLQDVGVLRVERVIGRRDRFAFAGDLRGHALGQFADRLLVDQQVELRLPQHVDEAGRDDESGGIDGALGSHARTGMADKRDTIPDNAHVGIGPRISAAIDDAAGTNEHVILLCQRAVAHTAYKKSNRQFDSCHGQLRKNRLIIRY